MRFFEDESGGGIDLSWSKLSLSHEKWSYLASPSLRYIWTVGFLSIAPIEKRLKSPLVLECGYDRDEVETLEVLSTGTEQEFRVVHRVDWIGASFCSLHGEIKTRYLC